MYVCFLEQQWMFNRFYGDVGGVHEGERSYGKRMDIVR